MKSFTTLTLSIMTLCSISTRSYTEETSVRIVPQLLVGNAGAEPGVALEVGLRSPAGLIIRPELFLSDDGIGGGGSVLWTTGEPFNFNQRHDFLIGPRVVYHNSDDYGMEVSAMGIWNIAIDNPVENRHSIEIIGALGVIDRNRDKKDSGNDIDFAASGGVAYAYRF